MIVTAMNAANAVSCTAVQTRMVMLEVKGEFPPVSIRSRSTTLPYLTTSLDHDPIKLNRDHGLAFCLSMIFFRKPVPTFRDHALARCRHVLNCFERPLHLGLFQQNRPIATLPQEFMSAMPPKADKPEPT
jgi:hypothetical protein